MSKYRNSEIFCLIYKLTNTINGKIYVGQTWQYSIKKRGGPNGNAYRSCKKLHNAIRKYGWINFQYELLVICHQQNMADYYEDYFIIQYKSNQRKHGYNIRNGGSRGKLTQSTKNKIAKKAMGRTAPNKGKPGKKPSDETRRKMSIARTGTNNPMYGKHHTDKTKQTISISSKRFVGENNPMYGKMHTEETKQKIAEKAEQRTGSKNPFFGKTHTNETKLAISNANKGKQSRLGAVLTNETKSKISKSLVGRRWKMVNGKRMYYTDTK